MSSAPLLADVVVDGKPRKVVAVPSKESFLYVFDRITGDPIWPIEERPVPQSDVPGEKTSPTQPFPTKPPAYGRNFIKMPDDLIDFTPEMRAQALDQMKRYRLEGMFTPPVIGDVNGKWLGGISLGNASGGTNVAGRRATILNSTRCPRRQRRRSSRRFRCARRPEGFTDIKYVSGRNDQPFREAQGPGFGSAADAPQPRRTWRGSSCCSRGCAGSGWRRSRSWTWSRRCGGGRCWALRVAALVVVVGPAG